MRTSIQDLNVGIHMCRDSVILTISLVLSKNLKSRRMIQDRNSEMQDGNDKVIRQYEISSSNVDVKLCTYYERIERPYQTESVLIMN